MVSFIFQEKYSTIVPYKSWHFCYRKCLEIVSKKHNFALISKSCITLAWRSAIKFFPHYTVPKKSVFMWTFFCYRLTSELCTFLEPAQNCASLDTPLLLIPFVDNSKIFFNSYKERCYFYWRDTRSNNKMLFNKLALGFKEEAKSS